MASSIQASADKELLLRIRKNTSHLEYYYEKGGEVPQALSGLFTDSFSAEQSKIRYLADRDRPKRAYKHPNPKAKKVA